MCETKSTKLLPGLTFVAFICMAIAVGTGYSALTDAYRDGKEIANIKKECAKVNADVDDFNSCVSRMEDDYKHALRQKKYNLTRRKAINGDYTLGEGLRLNISKENKICYIKSDTYKDFSLCEAKILKQAAYNKSRKEIVEH